MMNSVARPRRLLLALYLASAALVTVQQAILGHSNNLSIFRAASLNLFAGRDLYAAHPEQHFDFYKYSPTFALLFAPLAYLPFALAFLFWPCSTGCCCGTRWTGCSRSAKRPSPWRSCTSK